MDEEQAEEDIDLRLSSAQEALAALELKAGIRERTEDASLGPLNPPGVSGPRVSPGQYVSEAGEYSREKTREIVFAVPDIELRRAIISAYRECDAAYRASVTRQMKASQANLNRVIGQRTSAAPWLLAGAIAAGAAWLGARYRGAEGAIALGLVGLFLGQWQIHTARIRQEAEITAAREELAEARTSMEEGARDEWFTQREADTGEPSPGSS